MGEREVPPERFGVEMANAAYEQVVAERDRLRAALAAASEALTTTTSCLYDVWRCNTDAERAHHGAWVALLMDRYLKHPSRIAEDLLSERAALDPQEASDG